MSVETSLLIVAVVVTVTFLGLMVGAYVFAKRADRELGPPR